MGLKCAFSGHRDIQNFNREKLIIEIKKLIERGVTEFYCGMARGFDLVSAECIIELKNEFNLKLIACVPCPNQDKYFSYSDSKRYKSALEKCDEVQVLAPEYFKGCMQMRDRILVDSADIILCYLNKTGGGTFYTVNYAKKKNKEIINVA